MKDTLSIWLAGARPRTLPAAIAPILAGAASAAAAGSIDLLITALCAVVALALQVGVNYANDYSDGVRGTDDERVGPTRLVASGLASPRAAGNPRWTRASPSPKPLPPMPVCRQASMSGRSC